MWMKLIFIWKAHYEKELQDNSETANFPLYNSVKYVLPNCFAGDHEQALPILSILLASHKYNMVGILN